MRTDARVLLFLLIGFSIASQCPAAEPAGGGRYVLRLQDALKKSGDQTPVGLTVYVTLDSNGPRDVWAYEYGYNHSIHSGSVPGGKFTEAGATFPVELQLHGDPHAPGGTAHYELHLTRTAQTVEGDYAGSVETERGKYDVKGKATGSVLPLLTTALGFEPVKAGEHPRLLFRKSQLSALRERMKTPLGRSITQTLAESDDGSALGMMYQLTGDTSFADRAYAAAERTMAETGGGPFAVGRVWGYRVLAVAYDYDLCYDAWTRDQRHKCEQYMDQYCDLLLYAPQKLGQPNVHPGSNYMFVMYGGAGVAAMALWGEKGDETGAADPAALPVRRERGALGGSDRWAQMMLDGERLNYENIQRGIGDGGFQSEGEDYTLECAYVAWDYDLAHRNVFGTDVTGRPDLSDFVPRYVETTIYTGQRRRDWQSYVNQTYGRGDNAAAEWKYMARSMPLLPDAWKPAVLWYWLQGAGVSDFSDESNCQKLFTRPTDGKASKYWVFNDASILIFNFLYTPLDSKPQNPETVLPHAWEASGKSFYAFRDHWRGPDDIVAQIYGKGGPDVGWNQAEAGCFQIYGLGHEWAWKNPHGGTYGKTGSRWQDNVVVLPDDPIDANARCGTESVKTDPATGSGVVTLNLDNLYRVIKVDQGPKGPKRIVDGGIRGTRSFAADYSGRCGAPALFAVADHITGGGRKVWVFQLPRKVEKPAGKNAAQPPAAETIIDGNTFSIRYPDASMKATFVSPAGVKITEAPGAGANPLSGIPDSKDPVLQATAGDAGDFLVVLTIQRGDAPVVKSENGVATVGRQQIRFDGNTLELTPTP